MSERKVLNKYYPPDFDPSKIPRKKQLKNLQMKVRMMLPMSIRCSTCGNYIYKGTKFNCRKEDCIGDTYLGIMKFRFYFKCTKCSSELIMKTDPQNSDYTMESGATRNFEPWRQVDEASDLAKKQKEEEELGDAMKALENRTLDSKREMDIIAALDEMKSMRARQAGIDTNDALLALRQSEIQEAPSTELTQADEELVKSIVFKNSEKYVRRLEDDEELKSEAVASQPDGQNPLKKQKIDADSSQGNPQQKVDPLVGNTGKLQKQLVSKPFPVISVKPKEKNQSTSQNISVPSQKRQVSVDTNKSCGVEVTKAPELSSLVAYGASDDDEDE